MHEDEVLTTCLAYKARIGNITVEVRACLAPETLKGGGAASEVNACEVFALGAYLTDERAAAGQEVDNAVGQTGFLVQLHEVVVGE